MKSPQILDSPLPISRRAALRTGGLATLGALLGRPGSVSANEIFAVGIASRRTVFGGAYRRVVPREQG